MKNPFGESLEDEVVEAEVEAVVEEKAEVEEVKLPLAKTRKQVILDSYGGLESNVPINSPYWKS